MLKKKSKKELHTSGEFSSHKDTTHQVKSWSSSINSYVVSAQVLKESDVRIWLLRISMRLNSSPEKNIKDNGLQKPVC